MENLTIGVNSFSTKKVIVWCYNTLGEYTDNIVQYLWSQLSLGEANIYVLSYEKYRNYIEIKLSRRLRVRSGMVHLMRNKDEYMKLEIIDQSILDSRIKFMQLGNSGIYPNVANDSFFMEDLYQRHMAQSFTRGATYYNINYLSELPVDYDKSMKTNNDSLIYYMK